MPSEQCWARHGVAHEWSHAKGKEGVDKGAVVGKAWCTERGGVVVSKAWCGQGRGRGGGYWVYIFNPYKTWAGTVHPQITDAGAWRGMVRCGVVCGTAPRSNCPGFRCIVYTAIDEHSERARVPVPVYECACTCVYVRACVRACAYVCARCYAPRPLVGASSSSSACHRLPVHSSMQPGARFLHQ